MPRIFWWLLAAMVVANLSMNLITLPRIEELAGGLRLLDMRFTGYAYADVEAFVAAIGEEGAALYLGAQMWLDMIFPPLLGAVLFLLYRWLFPGRAGLIIGLISLSYVVVDWLENLAIMAVLRAGTEGLTRELAETANFYTTTKWSLALLGLVMLVIGVVWRLAQRRRTQTIT